MRGDAGHQVSGQGDEPAAAGDGIDKAAEKDQRQNDKQDLWRKFHEKPLFS